MTKLEDSLRELEATQGDMRQHFLYTTQIANEVLRALNQDAISHSNRLEPDTSSQETLRRLTAAWEYAITTFEGDITPRFIAEIATMVDPYQGKYRTTTATVRGCRGTYVMTNPAKIDREMNKLVDGVNNTRKHPVVTAAELHLYFAIIHPLDDGNGRVARLLQNVVLYHQEIPPMVIPHTERPTYLNHIEDALQGFRERSGQENMLGNQSHAEYRFIEYLVDKCKGSTERMAEKMGRLKKYQITITTKKDSKETVRNVRKVLRSALASQGGTLPVITRSKLDNTTLEVVTCVPEMALVGVLERYTTKPGKRLKYVISDCTIPPQSRTR